MDDSIHSICDPVAVDTPVVVVGQVLFNSITDNDTSGRPFANLFSFPVAPPAIL